MKDVQEVSYRGIQRMMKKPDTIEVAMLYACEKMGREEHVSGVAALAGEMGEGEKRTPGVDEETLLEGEKRTPGVDEETPCWSERSSATPPEGV